MGTIEERLARLERSARRWRAIACAGCLAGVCALLSAADGDALRLQKPIVIMDRAGTERIRLGLDADEQPKMEFFDRKHFPRLDLYVAKNNGRTGISLLSPDDGQSFPPKASTARLSMSAEGNGDLMIERSDGKVAHYPAQTPKAGR